MHKYDATVIATKYTLSKMVGVIIDVISNMVMFHALYIFPLNLNHIVTASTET